VFGIGNSGLARSNSMGQILEATEQGHDNRAHRAVTMREWIVSEGIDTQQASGSRVRLDGRQARSTLRR
jgi:hypothetical protein